MSRLRIAVLGLAVAACVPDVDTDESQLGAPRLLAVRAEPAEAAPGETVRFVALYADAGGGIDEAPIDWAYCTARKPLAELGPVSRACLEPSGDAILPIGLGIDVSGAVPRDACRLFGPEPPAAEAGQPAGRPVDADATGGYSQPVRMLVPRGEESAVSLFEARLACGLFGATQAESVEFTQRYRRNVAPRIDSLELVHEDGRTIELLPADIVDVAPGEAVTLRVTWPACAESDTCGDGLCGVDETRVSCAEDCTTPASCPGAERFLRFDALTRQLVIDRESIRVAWYTSGGTLASERTGVGTDDRAHESENTLLAPEAESDLTLVIVLRDARGGTTWREARLRVVP